MEDHPHQAGLDEGGRVGRVRSAVQVDPLASSSIFRPVAVG